MPSTQTMVAHCGACATGHMTLAPAGNAGAFYYVCGACGCQTAPRTTLVEASEDVVWATPAQSRQARRAAAAPNFHMATPGS